MGSVVLDFLKPYLWFLKLAGGQYVTFYGDGTADIRITHSKFYAIALHGLGILAYLNHLTALYSVFLKEAFQVDKLIMLISETAFTLQIIAITLMSFSNVPTFTALINCLVKFEKTSNFLEFPDILNFKFMFYRIFPITICSIIYFYGIFANFYNENYNVVVLKWPTIAISSIYFLFKEIYQITWWVIACLLYTFYNRSNQILRKLDHEKLSTLLIETLRVSFHLLSEATETLGSLFGLLTLGFLVNSNLMIQFDMHSIQMIIYQIFSRDFDNFPAFILLDSLRWLFVALLQTLMMFYLCNKIENEVSDFFITSCVYLFTKIGYQLIYNASVSFLYINCLKKSSGLSYHKCSP